MDVDSTLAQVIGTDPFVRVNDSLEIRELDGNISIGYYFPLYKKIGMGLELFQSVLRNDTILNGEPDSSYYLGRFGQGGMLSAGMALSVPRAAFSFAIPMRHFSLTREEGSKGLPC